MTDQFEKLGIGNNTIRPEIQIAGQATGAAQTDGSQKTQVVDDSGNVIASFQDADGGYSLGQAIIQNILTSSGNSTTANLASGATFTGTSEETFGINGIQVYHFVDQDCTIYIDQSLDGTNWDVSDSFECLASTSCTRTFISVAPYYRARITNDGDSTTTIVRFATGMTPVINPLPRALTDDGRLKVETTLIDQQNVTRSSWITPVNTLSVNTQVRLVGTNFDGTTKDPNFWTETVTNGGTVTQAGKITLSTNTTADATAQYDSVRTARFVGGHPLKYISACNFVTAGTTDNARRFGPYNDNNGGYFELDGTTFSIGYRSGGADVLVNSGSFNGNYGPSWDPVADTVYRFDIEWLPLGAFFYINGKLLHTVTGGTPPQQLSLPIRMENVNDNGSTSDVDLECHGAVIIREGNLTTNPISYYQSGTTAGVVLKYGPGTLRGAVISGVANNSVITIYDNTAASGTVIWSSGSMGAQTQPYELNFHELPFSTGLTLVIATASSNITLIYE